MNLSELLEILSRASATSAMVLVIWALMTERLIPKKRLDDCIESRERVIKQRDDLQLEHERNRAQRHGY